MAKLFNTRTGRVEDDPPLPPPAPKLKRTKLAPSLFIEVPEPTVILNGSGAPAAETGEEGDFYIDTEGWVIYGPKTETWPEGASIVGPKGDDGLSIKGDQGDSIQGPQGLAGRDGVAGAPGQDGGTGAPGPVGKAGPAGPAGKDGVDGREIELGRNQTHIQWRYVGEKQWHDLMAVPKNRAAGGGGGAHHIEDLAPFAISKEAYIETPSDKTYPLDTSARFKYRVAGLYQIQTASGSCTAALKKNGVAITGLSAIAVTSTPQDVAATALNDLAVGDALTLVITSNSSAADLQMAIKAVRT